MSLLKAENVTFSYDKKIICIKDFSLEVNQGEYIAVVGKNGSGKSTLARLFNALIKPDKGKITVDGFSSDDKNSLFEIRKRVGVVFQNPDNGIIASIVEDDVAFGPENLGLPREEIGKRIDFALKAVGMEKYKKSSTTRLSGGQKQRVAIAGVLALKPEILILDESTAMLDPKGRNEILEVIKNLNEKEKVTVITITHYMEEIVGADRVIVMNDGVASLVGTPEEVFAHGKELKNYGIELPYSAYIQQKLKEKGVNIDKPCLTERDLAEALCELL